MCSAVSWPFLVFGSGHTALYFITAHHVSIMEMATEIHLGYSNFDIGLNGMCFWYFYGKSLFSTSYGIHVSLCLLLI